MCNLARADCRSARPQRRARSPPVPPCNEAPRGRSILLRGVTQMGAVAVLGTGRMGGAIARRLKASGFDLTLWNRAKEKAQRLNVGAVASTPAEAVHSADIVISSLTGPAAVRGVYWGPNGVFTNSTGKLLIEMSTAGPEIDGQLSPGGQAK